MEQSISADEAPAEELNRHAPEMGSEIDSHSTSAVLQLQVRADTGVHIYIEMFPVFDNLHFGSSGARYRF